MSPFVQLQREIPATFAEVDALCLQLRGFLVDGMAVTERESFAVELLAREALSNAVRHGCLGDGSKRVRFQCRLGSRRAVLRVEDEGPGFPWRAALERPPDDEASHGRGLALYRIYASRLFFNARGNRILLIRHFPESIMPENPAPLDGTHALLHPGDLTSATVEHVRGQLKTLLGGGTRQLTIDLAGVQMVDSMGIGLLIQTNNSLAKLGGSLTVIHASSELMDLFRSMRLDKRFTIQD